MSNIFIGLKNNLFGCFKNKGECANGNATGLKEGGGIEMSTTVLSIYAMLAPFALYVFHFAMLAPIPFFNLLTFQ